MGTLHTMAVAARPNPHQISLDILGRWSPKLMTGEPLTASNLQPLFEAARWAPSGRNLQEWRFYYALRQDNAFASLLDMLSESNQQWCAQAGALLFLVSQKIAEDGRVIRPHSLDTGMAFENFAIEGARRDLVVHPLGGFDRQKAVDYLNLGDAFEVEIMIAVGKPASLDDLRSDRQVTQRNPQESFVFHLA